MFLFLCLLRGGDQKVYFELAIPIIHIPLIPKTMSYEAQFELRPQEWSFFNRRYQREIHANLQSGHLSLNQNWKTIKAFNFQILRK